MNVLDVKMHLLPDEEGHHRLAFADVVLGNGRPLVLLRPFVVYRQDSGVLTVQWPAKRDKKNGGTYQFVKLLDHELADAIQKEVLARYEAARLLKVMPTAPGRPSDWYRHPRRGARAGRVKY